MGHTDTGIGYIEDADGNVKAHYNLPPGDHPLDGTMVDVQSESDLPPIDSKYQDHTNNYRQEYRDARSNGDTQGMLDALFKEMTGELP